MYHDVCNFFYFVVLVWVYCFLIFFIIGLQAKFIISRCFDFPFNNCIMLFLINIGIVELCTISKHLGNMQGCCQSVVTHNNWVCDEQDSLILVAW